MTRNYSFILILVCAFLLAGCATVNPFATPQDKRNIIMNMHDDTLSNLYQVKPQVRSLLESSPGYAVFSDSNVNLIFASFSGGYGVAINNQTGKKTYLKMGEAGVGLGLGVKNFSAIMIFHNEPTMNRFINDGWQFGAHADAAAIINKQGEAVGGEMLLDNITIYQLTRSGLALQATVKGTRYWKSATLN